MGYEEEICTGGSGSVLGCLYLRNWLNGTVQMAGNPSVIMGSEDIRGTWAFWN